MGLLPLEFVDCLLDSPYFRENLKSHERQLEDTSASIKELIGGLQNVIQCARSLSDAKLSLAKTMENFQFDCLGNTLTDDEMIIATSLKQFSKFFTTMETEIRELIEEAENKFINPLISFRKNQIDNVKQSKKSFEKASKKLCDAQDRYVRSSRKEESLSELSENVRLEQRNLNSSSLDYVYNIHLVQEKKKFEFVEILLKFTQSWLHYYRSGYRTSHDFEQYVIDLDSRVKKTRDNYSNTVERYSSLKDKMTQNGKDPGLFNKMYARQGYLYVQGKKSMKMGQGWYKHFCQLLQVQDNTKRLTLIPYSQTDGKVGAGETISVINCLCKDDLPEKFRFTVTGRDLSNGDPDSDSDRIPVVTFTLQALSDHERKLWVEALGGSWPTVSTLQRLRADSVEENLNSAAFSFLKDCLEELEHRGMNEVGLYRVGGVTSKVKDFLNQAIDPEEITPDIRDPKAWESKTLASAVKHYLRELSKPLLTYHLFNRFLEAAKLENDNERVHAIKSVMRELPEANRQLIKVLIQHLHKVAQNSEHNKMTASNLGVVFGPTLLRPKEETCASIVDIKFRNQVIEILIEKAEIIFNVEEMEVDGGLVTPLSDLSTSSPHLQTRGSDTSSSSPHLQTRGSETSSSSPRLQERGSETSSHLGNSWRSLSSKTSQHSPGSNHKFEDGESGGSSPCLEKENPASKCKRAQSLSELSVNSLPEIVTSSGGRKQISPHHVIQVSTHHVAPISGGARQSPTIHESSTESSLGSDRPRSKSYQLEKTSDQSFKMSTSMTTSQADLTSSLELMNRLASDLPAVSSSTLRRTSTTQLTGSGKGARAGRQDVTRKPPLPKLTGITSPSSSFPPSPFPTCDEEGGGAMSPGASTSTGLLSPGGSSAGGEGFVEGGGGRDGGGRDDQAAGRFQYTGHTSSSGHQHRRASENSLNLPSTKLKYDKHKRNNSQDSGVLLSPSPATERRRTLSVNTDGSSGGGGRSKAGSPAPPHLYHRGERGHTASPSFERLGGGGLSRGNQSEDTSSLASLSLSESSEASVSRYENTACESPRPPDSFPHSVRDGHDGGVGSGNGGGSGGILGTDRGRGGSHQIHDEGSRERFYTDYREDGDRERLYGESAKELRKGGSAPDYQDDNGNLRGGAYRNNSIEDNLKLLEERLLRDSPDRRQIRTSGPYENDEIERNIYELENVVTDTGDGKEARKMIRPHTLDTGKSSANEISGDEVSKQDYRLGDVTRQDGVYSDVIKQDGGQSSVIKQDGGHDEHKVKLNIYWDDDKSDVLTSRSGLASLKNLLNSSPASNV